MIHQYKLGGYNIVLDICSGSVHAVDDVAYDIISMFESSEKEAVIAAMKEKYADIVKCDEDVLSCALFEQVAVKFLEAKNAPKEENEIEEFEVVIG